ncbi:MAG TPA: radical SAM protein [Gemmatimonadaceae bacterium]|nr:radical SAM protein [Gemmatimonadaceae bacterium]
MTSVQTSIFPEQPGDASRGRTSRSLPVIGAQRDITYHASAARRLLNGPETTGMGFWSINPYVGCAFGCAYCYARYAHRYVMERAGAPEAAPEAEVPLPPWLAFERRILVKENAAAALRRDLRPGAGGRRPERGDTIVIGTATDPYQPAERRYRLTRTVLEVLAGLGGPAKIVIITKSPLVTRDIDLLQALARLTRISVHVSLITLDRELARRLEPRAPTPESRLRAIERLSAAGIRVGVNCMPVLPGITDRAADLDALVRRVAAAGAAHLAAGSLRLRRTARERYLPFIAEEFPHLDARYRAAYGRGHQLPAAYRDRLAALVRRLCERHGLPWYTYGGDEEQSPAAGAAAAASPAAPQLELWDGRG